MTCRIVRMVMAVSTFPPILCCAAPQGTPPQPSASPAASATVVCDHQREKGQSRIYTREWDDGHAFQVDILNACPGWFDWEITGIVADQAGVARQKPGGGSSRAPEDEQLPTMSLNGKNESMWGGDFVTIRTKSEPPQLPCEDKRLSETTLVITVATGWQISAPVGFVGSGLTDPVCSLGPYPDPGKTGNVVNVNKEQRDAVKLGLAAFVFVTTKRWPVIPLAFGLGVDSDNRTADYFGPGIPFGDQAVLTGGVAIGSVSRLPNGTKAGEAVSAGTTLDTLPTRTVVRWFFGVSCSFISTGDRLTKPLAGPSWGPGPRHPASIVFEIKSPATLSTSLHGV